MYNDAIFFVKNTMTRYLIKRIFYIFVSFFFLFLSSGTSATVLPLSVQGSKVLVGELETGLAGNSLFWSNNSWGGDKFYNRSVIQRLKNDWNSRIVRVAMGVEGYGGYLEKPTDNLNKVITIIDAAIAEDMYVIVDWHSHKAEGSLPEAIGFFREIASRYKDHHNIIYEIYNEPLSVSWVDTIKPYAESVITEIRKIDPDNLILVGTPNYSQDVDDVVEHPIVGFDNLAYVLHFYAGSHKQWLRDKAQFALDNGVPLFVSEWGTVNYDGNGDVDENETQAWMTFLKNNGISHANWSINDKDEGASALIPGASTQGNWSDSDLTPSGRLVKQIIKSWNASDSGGNTNQPPVCDVAIIPGAFDAEDFCDMQGIQLEETKDIGGGQNVGWIDEGDWLDYLINPQDQGDYIFSFRVASLNGGGALQIENEEGISSSPIAIPATQGWQNWITVSDTYALQAGEQTLRIKAQKGGFNINWIAVNQPPVSSEYATIAEFQAEDYVAMDGIQTEQTTDNGGGLNVGWIDAGDWMAYAHFNVDMTGEYEVEYRVASLSGGGKLELLEENNTILYGSVDIPQTSDWQNWISVKQKIQLEAGRHSFTVRAANGGWNLNWIKVNKKVVANSTPTPTPTLTSMPTFTPTPTTAPTTTPTISPTSSPTFTSTPVPTPTLTAEPTPEPTLTLSPSATPDPMPTPHIDNEKDWLSVSGNKIIDAKEREVWLTGANWFGFNASEKVLHGLWTANLEALTGDIANRGINILRVPISTELLTEWMQGTPADVQVNTFANPELEGLNSLEVFERFLAACQDVGLKIFVDVHSAQADNMGHFAPLWFDHEFTQEDFYTTWEWFAERYKNNDTVLAFDLKNEPHGQGHTDTPGARWDDSNHPTNWKAVAEETARRIHKVHPNALILVEGIEVYPREGANWGSKNPGDYHYAWWGGNLRGVADFPVSVHGQTNKIVYSPHDYGPAVNPQSWFRDGFNQETLIADYWYDNWLFIHDEAIAPLLIGEWGGFMDGADNQRWMEALRDLIVERKLHHTFWAINPNSGDTGGLLTDDWITWEEDKYALLLPALWQDERGRFIGLDHDVPLGANGISLNDFYNGTR